MRKLWLSIAVITLFLTACDKKEILPGKREAISGIAVNDNLRSAAPIKAGNITINSPSKIDSYTDIAGNKQHNSIHYKIDSLNKVLWKTSIGRSPINSNILVFGENVYAVDSQGTLVCISEQSGKKLWEKRIAKQPDGAVFSGGMAINNGVIYIATNIGTIVAIDSKTQKELWIKSVKYPLHGAPLYVSGKIIASSIENQTFAIDANNGSIVWTKTFNKEQTIMEKTGTPAVFGNDIICACSSGDIISLNIQNGADNWSDVLVPSNTSDSGVTISHIAMSPLVFGDNVLVAASESKMVLIDAISGIRIWEQNIGTLNSPVINNGWIFILTNDNIVACLSCKDGSIKWKADIRDICSSLNKKYENREWTGPLIINGEILVFSNAGDVLDIDVSTGKLKGQKKYEIFKGVNTAKVPVIVDGQMFVVTSRGDLCKIG
ncbi:MAG: PQQ-like beta-propeller repeat protein [Holosporales bacterium]|jgi:outer membrane protein assembly factor BamB|nr:PQQ-like beta-propeller repeat protein [Holosporales bacterium]